MHRSECYSAGSLRLFKKRSRLRPPSWWFAPGISSSAAAPGRVGPVAPDRGGPAAPGPAGPVAPRPAGPVALFRGFPAALDPASPAFYSGRAPRRV